MPSPASNRISSEPRDIAREESPRSTVGTAEEVPKNVSFMFTMLYQVPLCAVLLALSSGRELNNAATSALRSTLEYLPGMEFEAIMSVTPEFLILSSAFSTSNAWVQTANVLLAPFLSNISDALAMLDPLLMLYST